MPSRQKRKRARRRAEATAASPHSVGGWGHGLPVSRSDLLLARKAIRLGWPVSDRVRQAVISDVCSVALGDDIRHSIAAVRVLLDAEDSNHRNGLAAIKAEQPAPAPPWDTDAPVRR